MIKRPVNRRLLLDVLEHSVHGQALRTELTTPEPLSPHRCSTFNPKSEMRSFSVMVADDTELVRNSLQRQLSKYTKNVTACSDGLQLVTLYGNSPKDYDMLVVDNQMPIMDGLTTIRAVRKFEAGNNWVGNPVPIICNDFSKR